MSQTCGISIRAMILDQVPETIWGRLSSMLDSVERAQAGRFSFERDRRSYIAAHALKRAMLTAAVSGAVRPEAWQFETGKHGKPRIAGSVSHHFNLSHCEGAVVCAVSKCAEIGVDVERVDRPAPLELAETHFAASERAWLRQQPVDRRHIAFFKLWTLKEAYIKATGCGLAQRLDAFAFDFEPLRIRFEDLALGDASTWRFEQTLIGSKRHMLAMAWRSGGAAPLRAMLDVVQPAGLPQHPAFALAPGPDPCGTLPDHPGPAQLNRCAGPR
jgi:4'-phosphopantetheinyl transferase